MPDEESIRKLDGLGEKMRADMRRTELRGKMQRGAAYVALKAELGQDVSMRTMYGAFCAVEARRTGSCEYSNRSRKQKRIYGGYGTREEMLWVVSEGMVVEVPQVGRNEGYMRSRKRVPSLDSCKVDKVSLTTLEAVVSRAGRGTHQGTRVCTR